MGVTFDLKSINWLAYLLDKSSPMPRMENPDEERFLLTDFLERLGNRFVASKESRTRIQLAANEALNRLNALPFGKPIPPEYLDELRGHLEIGPWAALIVPSGGRSQVDRYLCSAEFLKALVNDEVWPDAGIVLQPEDSYIFVNSVSFTDVFPAFRLALANITAWPGMLFWAPDGDAAFFSFPTTGLARIREAAGWLLSNISLSHGMTISHLKSGFEKRFPSGKAGQSSVVTLLHMSDLHIGSQEASIRLGRLQQIVRNLISELPENSTIVPIVTGDIMDDPDIANYDEASRFVTFLHDLNLEKPVVVLGNHDVRRDGYLNPDLKAAIRLPNEGVRWMKEQKIALASFNSTVECQSLIDLAKGHIGERQFLAIGNEIDRHKDWRDFLFFGLLHHHPTPVTEPDWHSESFFEKVFGSWAESTVELKDADVFCRFVNERSFGGVLHGHKHIPRIDKIPGPQEIPIFGCGSSVGKVKTRERDEVYVSVNAISVDRRNNKVVGRLMAEQVAGGGAKVTHEVVSKLR